jgi:hypothetical protein
MQSPLRRILVGTVFFVSILLMAQGILGILQTLIFLFPFPFFLVFHPSSLLPLRKRRESL